MKKLLILVFLLLAAETKAQNFPKNPNKTDKNNLKQGAWTTLHDKDYAMTNNKDSTSFYAVGEMINDKQNGTWTYFVAKTNIKKKNMIFQNGILNGLSETYYDNGNISARGLLTNNVYQGVWYTYHLNGQTHLEIMFKDDKKIGIAKEYDETGKIIREVEYENGEPKETPQKTNQTWGEIFEEGKGYLKTGESGKAILVFEKVRVQTEKEVGKKHEYYVKVLDNLAYAYKMNKQFDKAKEISLEALAILKTLAIKEGVFYANLLNTLFSAQFNLEDFSGAEQTGTKLLAIYKRTLGEKSENYIIMEKNLAGVRKEINKK